MQRSLTYIKGRAIITLIVGVILPAWSAHAASLTSIVDQPELTITEWIASINPRLRASTKPKSTTLYVKASLPVWNAALTKAASAMTVAELLKHKPEVKFPTQGVAQKSKSTDAFSKVITTSIAGVQIRVFPKAADPLPEKIAEPKTNIFKIRLVERETKLTPDALHFVQQGDKVHVVIEQNPTRPARAIQIFVRDQAIVVWHQDSSVLEAKAIGTSELYVVVDGGMRIVPIFVGKTDVKGFELPEKLASLDGLMPQPNYESARFAGLEKNNSIQPDTNDDSADDDGEDKDSVTLAAEEIVENADQEIADALTYDDEQDAGDDVQADIASSKEKSVLSVQDSAADVARTLAKDAEERVRFGRETHAVAYTKVTLQVIDERSRPEQSIIYPVIGAQVHVVGTEFIATTNGTGHVVLSDMPRASRFLVNVHHPAGEIRPVVAEISTPSTGDAGVVRLRAMRHDALDNLAAMARTSQRADTASVCVSLQVKDGAQLVAADGYSVTLDASHEGPVYFSQYGFVDVASRMTGIDGRACFFNVDPGPLLMQIAHGGEIVGSTVLAAYPGMHSEESISLADVYDFEAGLGIIATAAEQLGSDRKVADGWRSIEATNIQPLGSGQVMQFVRDGIMSSNDELGPSGRSWFVTQSSEFEPAIQALDAVARRGQGKGTRLLSLIPRGFLEDMSVYAQVSYDQSLGAVLVEHGHLQGQGNTPVAVRLLNESGADVGDGWYFNDQPTTKALFFNVPPGRYTLLVETNDRYWLAADTLIVYSETLTIVQTGNRPVSLK